MLIEGLCDDVNHLSFIGASWDAAVDDPIGILAIFPEIQIHVVCVVVHGSMFPGIKGSEIDTKCIFVTGSEDPLGEFRGVDGSHNYQLIYQKGHPNYSDYSSYDFTDVCELCTSYILL